jgi:hypothetical protein
MQVKLSLKSIEPVRSDQGQGLAFTYVASSQEIGKLELKILTTIQIISMLPNRKRGR